MKYILIALIVFPSIAFAQAKADYEQAIGKFMKFYNAGQTDSIINQYSEDWGTDKTRLWTPEINKQLKEKYGQMVSYKYIGMAKEDNVAVLKLSLVNLLTPPASRSISTTRSAPSASILCQMR